MALNATAIAFGIRNTLEANSEQQAEAYADGEGYSQPQEAVYAEPSYAESSYAGREVSAQPATSVADRVQQQLDIQAAREQQAALEMQQE